MSGARKTIQINPQYLVQNKKKTGGKKKKCEITTKIIFLYNPIM